MKHRYNVIIIGAGAIGCAVAYEIAKKPRESKIALLEKNESEGLETSRFNSGVIHSGIHLDPKSLKAKLAGEGKKMVVAFCRRHGVAHRKCGMMIVAGSRDARELRALAQFKKRAELLGLRPKNLSAEAIAKHEPSIQASKALWIQGVYEINASDYVTKLLDLAKKAGHVDAFWRTPVLGIKKYPEYYGVRTKNGLFEAPIVINAAGLYADGVARMAGFNYTQKFYSGEYYKVISKKKNIFRGTLVYPAITPNAHGLGIHATKKMDGAVYLGPNASPSKGPLFGGKHSTKRSFLDAVRPFWPSLEEKDLAWGYVGMRAKAAGRKKNDFIIRKDHAHPDFINLIGIESPGLTASLAIAGYVKNLLGLRK